MSSLTGAHTDNAAHRLGGQTLVFVLGYIFTLAVGLPLQVYIARTFGPENLGILSLFEGGISFIAGLASLGIAPTIVRFVPEYLVKQDYQSLRAVLRRGAIVLVLATSLAMGGWLIFSRNFNFWWPDAGGHELTAIIMAPLIILGPILFFLQQGLRAFQEFVYLVIGSSVVQLTVKAAAVLLFINWGLGLNGYAFALVVSTLLAVVWMFVGLTKKVRGLSRGREDGVSSQGRRWIQYSFVMYGNGLLGNIASQLDRFLLAAFAGAGPVGVLAVVRQLQQLPAIFLQVFLSVVAPMFSAAHARDNPQELQHLLHLTTDWVFRAAFPLILFIGLFGEELLKIYGAQFALSGTYALYILIATQVIVLLFGPVGNLLNMCGEERVWLRFTVLQTLLTSVGFVLLIPKYELIGAAVSIAVAVTVVYGCSVFVAIRRLSIVWWDARYLRWILPSIVSATIGFSVAHIFSGGVGPFVLLGGLAAMYAGFIVFSLVQGLHDDDVSLLRHIRTRIFSQAIAQSKNSGSDE